MDGGWDKAREVSRRVGRGIADAGRAGARAGRATAGGTRRAGVATARGARQAGLATARGARSVGRATRRLTHAGGAGRTGLGRLIELTAGHSVGDTLVTVALASTVFFGVPVGEARGPVALYLVITMLPFALLAPFVGPILDRFRSGRRYVMAGTLFGRGLLCFAMAAAVGPGDLVTLFGGALGVLVLSKAYNVSRAAIMPSVLPADITLVSANARVALFSLVSAGVVVPVGAGLAAWLGSAPVLRIAMVVFLLVGVFAVRLPRHVDAPDLEEDGDEGRAPRWRTLLQVGPAVAEAVWANVAIRLFSGFLLFFLLFLVQDGQVPWLAGPAPLFDVPRTIALLAAAAGLGGLVGAVVANRARDHSPQVIVLLTLALTSVTTIVTAVFFGLWTAFAISVVTAFAQELGKLALDAIVQREIGEEVRSSTFGVVEALLQLAWVFGGLVGLVLSLTESGVAGLVTLAVALTAALGWLVIRRRARLRAVRERIDATVRAERPEPRDTLDPTKPLTNPNT
ncbi:MFS transporter [Nonomuraea muscovyensis]|uniref:MFS family permease n=1 Tax=Nonomuraea muscovyensis TaxID=1124761 RepID=A0A7X0EVB7_9ACTN|nr:MFS transporter [Nonomuraea muscovyensis]MBB6345363.1 MFS family permease [Nonomuraea muscovyensis]